jgi:hypothetical protein
MINIWSCSHLSFDCVRFRTVSRKRRSSREARTLLWYQVLWAHPFNEVVGCSLKTIALRYDFDHFYTRKCVAMLIQTFTNNVVSSDLAVSAQAMLKVLIRSNHKPSNPMNWFINTIKQIRIATRWDVYGLHTITCTLGLITDHFSVFSKCLHDHVYRAFSIH